MTIPRRPTAALMAALSAARASVMGVARAGLDLALPITCPGCGAAGRLCDGCTETLVGLPRTVIMPPASVDHLAAARLPMPRVYALSHYGGPARAAIIAAKDRGERYLPAALGRSLAVGLVALQEIGALPADLWLVPAPSRKAAARARGGDPVLALTRSAAGDLAAAGRAVGIAPCLFSARGVRDSVGLDAAGRAANLIGSVRFDPRRRPPPGAAIILIDDVFTTGATTVASYLALAERHYVINSVLVITSAAPLQPTVIRAGTPRATFDRTRARHPGGTR